MNKLPVDIMRRGSTTFFNSSLFFPPSVRRDVVTLYAFVRTADDYVDSIPQDADGFHAFADDYLTALNGGVVQNPVITGFVELAERRGFQAVWIDAFLNVMAQDLWKKEYETLEETIAYMHGSAETVGLMMARVMSLPDEALPCAALLGRAFQYINFVRDIREDLELGRTYIPTEDLAEFNVPGLTLSKATEWPDIFSELVRKQLLRYRQWKREAEEGFRFIPARYLVAVRTAADMFDMTAAEIERNPEVVLQKKVKPSKRRVITAGIRNLVGIGRRA